MDPHITETAPTDWKYISEGGSSIVFSYTGPPNPDFDETALRLRKVDHDSSLTDTPSFEEVEPDDPSIIFQHRIIERLFPSTFLPHLDAVKVDGPWLEKLSHLVEEHRPEERRERDKIDMRKHKAVLATDLVGGHGWAVEIKPKWGFLPNPTHLFPESKALKTQTCRFCMHSHLKSTEGEEVSLGYCPLDLYSGEEERVRKALNSLWDVWIGSSGSVNNFRIFVEGHMLHPSTFPSSLTPLAQQVFHANAAEPSLDTLRDQVISVILSLLMETPVLSTLAKHQRNLDVLDVEGLASLWQQVKRSDGIVPPLGEDIQQPTIDELDDFITSYLEGHAKMDHDHPDPANLRYYCIAYLLSASFKDCSIIIGIHRAENGRPEKHTITVIDLDIKNIDRLSKWERLDQKIVKAYSGVPNPVICTDKWAKLP